MHLQDQMPTGEGFRPDLTVAHPDCPEVHQATGIVSVQVAVGVTEALLLLRAHAFSSERPILVVARDVHPRIASLPPDSEDHG